MTTTDFEKLVRLDDPDKLADAVLSLTESERQQFAPVAARLMRENPMRGARLAVLGLCGLADAKDVRPPGRFDDASVTMATVRVLKARCPEWLDQWVEHLLVNHHHNWYFVRALVREGICTRPISDNYVLGMLGDIYTKEPLAENLRKAPDLLMNEFWRIFEINPGKHVMMPVSDADAPPQYSWTKALVELASAGELDRQRLLTVSITALQHHEYQSNIAWFARFHESLQPTPQERIARQPHYLDLLGLPPATAGFALTALKAIALAGQLDLPRFAEALPSVYAIPQKTHSATAIQILKLASRHADPSMIAAAAAPALSHSKPDVRKAAAALIESLNKLSPSAISPELQNTAAAARTGKSPQPPAPVADASPDLAALKAKASTIPANWRCLAGIDAFLSAIDQNTPIPPLTFGPLAVPRLYPENRITPIQTLDELIESLSAALERLEDADEFERILDGLSRLADQRPNDFAARTAPLLKRATKYFDSFGRGYDSADLLSPEEAVALLAITWIQGTPWRSPGKDFTSGYHIFEFLTARVGALTQQLSHRLAAPLLSAPTHKGGWICPMEFASRLHTWAQLAKAQKRKLAFSDDGLNPSRHDFIQALIRLAPDRRVEAARQLDAGMGEVGTIAAFALGHGRRPKTDPDLTIAAERARDPYCTISGLDGPDAIGPDAAQPPAYTWNEDGEVTATPAAPRDARNSLPTVLIHAEGQFRPDNQFPIDIRYRAAVWPANPDPSFSFATQMIARRIEKAAGAMFPISLHLEPLFDPDIPFTEMAQLTLALCLVAKDAGASGMAVDALIALTQDGRCTGHELGQIFSRIRFTRGRLAKSLTDAARVSPLLQETCIRIVEGAISALPTYPPSDLAVLLETLESWLQSTGRALSDLPCPSLQKTKATGKTAKLIKSLLNLPAAPSSAWQSQVHAAALRARIERADRWAAQASAFKEPHNDPV